MNDDTAVEAVEEQSEEGLLALAFFCVYLPVRLGRTSAAEKAEHA